MAIETKEVIRTQERRPEDSTAPRGTSARAEDIRVGMRVSVLFLDGVWYPGTVSGMSRGGWATVSFEDGYVMTVQVPDPAFKVLEDGGGREEGERNAEQGKSKEGVKEKAKKREKRVRVKDVEKEEEGEIREEKGRARRMKGGARERAEARMLQEALKASLGHAGEGGAD